MALSLAIGYPVAYYAARHAGRWRALVLLLLVLPFWINYLMRMLAWINLLSPDGWGTRFLHDFGIEALFEKLGLLLAGRGLAQRAGVLGRDRARLRLHPVLHPAALRGARPHRPAPHRGGARSRREPVRRVPARHAAALGPGILAGAVLIALPMFGDYYTNDLISASPRTTMIGNQIDQFTRQGSQKTVGAVLTMLLALVLLVLMFYYLRTTRRADLERAR